MNHCLEFTSAEFFFWLPSSKQEPITRHRIAIRRTIPLVPAVAALAIACASAMSLGALAAHMALASARCCAVGVCCI